MPFNGASRLVVIACCALLVSCAPKSGFKGSGVAPDKLPAKDVVLDLKTWPKATLPAWFAKDAATEKRINDLIKRMTLEEKVGQILQPEITNVTPEDVKQYNLGSVLNGGNGRPDNDPYATAEQWLALADAYYDASVDTSDGGVGIPIIWGIDSVHGNNSLFGATILPHNVGLGATHDPALMRELGRVTAVETSAIGVDWTFAPAVSVARDDRWGRTYESFSEDPALVGTLAAAYVEGLQGTASNDASFFSPGSVIATGKHFIADGGTKDGRDQGDAVIPETELRDLHMPGYVTTLNAGLQTVMASYSKWNGTRMHGHGPLLTTLLKDHMGFDGFVIGDFNGHALIPGCTRTDCPDALLAGVDMYMIPADWKTLYENLIAQVKSGEIPMARLDDAVRRVLRVKARYGVLDAGRPSSRPFAGREHVGTPEHREIARRAARQSAVLLKNEGNALPIAPGKSILVAGSGADTIPMLVGGWSMNWQGTGLTNKDFPTGASVFAALAETAGKAGGKATLSRDGTYSKKPDAAVVIFGEFPYAEYQGDRESVISSIAERDKDLAIMRRLKVQGVPVISVFISGRPLWINPHLNSSDAVIAAWLPGTEGGRALADLIVQDPAKPGFDFSGTLSFSWPKTAGQMPLNAGDGQSPLFAPGYGLKLGVKSALGQLSEDPEISETLLSAAENSVFFKEGRALAPWRVYLGDAGDARLKTEGDRFVESTAGAIKYESEDRNRQEDTKRIEWTGKGAGKIFVLGYSTVDFTNRFAQKQAIVMELKVDAPPQAPVRAAFGTVKAKPAVDIAPALAKAAGKGWTTVSVPLACFDPNAKVNAAVDMPFALETDGAFTMRLADLRLGPATGENVSCGR